MESVRSVRVCVYICVCECVCLCGGGLRQAEGEGGGATESANHLFTFGICIMSCAANGLARRGQDRVACRGFLMGMRGEAAMLSDISHSQITAPPHIASVQCPL